MWNPHARGGISIRYLGSVYGIRGTLLQTDTRGQDPCCEQGMRSLNVPSVPGIGEKCPEEMCGIDIPGKYPGEVSGAGIRGKYPGEVSGAGIRQWA